MSYESITVQMASTQALTSLFFLILGSTVISILALVALFFLFFRWLEGGTTRKLKVSVCMYCGSRSLSVSPMKDAAGRNAAFCYCNSCKRSFSLDIPA